MHANLALMSNKEKEAVGKSAVELVQDGMVVGLGTGSTIKYVIRDLGKKIKEGLDILGIPTSHQTELLSIQAGIPLTTLWEHPVVDIAIDGADQVDSMLNCVKGQGAAHTREKIMASSASRFVVIVDESKMVDVLNCPVPLEVLPYALRLVELQVTKFGGVPRLRAARKKDGPVITDNGNFVLDVDFGEIMDPKELDAHLSNIVGVIGHGIFTNVDEVHVGRKSGVEVLKKS
ncbi:MAG TPA: ribose-5-phosphate isomerase RpiA [Methanocellales archaeon]|nr:ribose-5-phosphate isomerase RpiA [Methanocellales archaeon]